MADITPITREEFYLAKAGGQDVPVPSAVTREEYYLEKLSNDSVVVPTPVTRREKFLYFACGGEIDLPSEEKMTRLERLIAKAGGMDVSTPTAVTRLEKFWANVENGGWTITGVLPLTFTAKAGNAVDWEIKGNDHVGENLFDGTIVQGVWNSLTGQVPRMLSSSTRLATSTMLAVDATETYNLKIFSATSDTLVLAIKLLNSAKEQIIDTGWVGVSTSISGADYIVVNIRKVDESVITPADVAGITITKGSTAPDHYIPYQQGVGERTENLLNAQTYEVGKAWNTSSNPDRATATIVAEPNTTYTLKVFESVADLVYIGVKESPTATTAVTSQQTTSGTVTITTTATAYTLAIQLNKTAITSSDCQSCKITLTAGSTAPTTYIPHGYQIPLTVSRQGQTDKSYNIYIGDSPLTEGETVSKTSTGVDIELFEGENTVSTTLYNKPTMEIKYK